MGDTINKPVEKEIVTPLWQRGAIYIGSLILIGIITAATSQAISKNAKSISAEEVENLVDQKLEPIKLDIINLENKNQSEHTTIKTELNKKATNEKLDLVLQIISTQQRQIEEINRDTKEILKRLPVKE